MGDAQKTRLPLADTANHNPTWQGLEILLGAPTSRWWFTTKAAISRWPKGGMLLKQLHHTRGPASQGPSASLCKQPAARFVSLRKTLLVLSPSSTAADCLTSPPRRNMTEPVVLRCGTAKLPMHDYSPMKESAAFHSLKTAAPEHIKVEKV